MDEDSDHKDFIREIVASDISSGACEKVKTRFPPEPNGYLHIGHAKAICLNFGIAKEFGGTCNLRFDDTNPSKENIEYVESIKKDVRWLGFDWENREFYASDYFEKLYEYAVSLIRKGKAYVCDLSADEISSYRGTLTSPGKESPYRNRTIEENIELFRGMREGEFPDGAKTLRAKIDMASPNIIMRDPVMFRIMRAHHYRSADKWCIYPIYDYAHCVSDSIEGISHSICTLEFEIHRPLYDWFLEALEIHRSRQYEFARLNLAWTIMSKRKLLTLVKEKHVSGWDDPRMPTISGMRRRGYPPEAIRNFCALIGVTKYDAVTDLALLEHCVRDVLNKIAARFMAVMNPLKLTIVNYPEEKTEELEAINNPEDLLMGTRLIPFSRTLFIEKDDFCENPPKKYFRLFPGNEVRLRYAYVIKCVDFKKDPSSGEINEIFCEYLPETRGGNVQDGKKIKGTIHWVSQKHAKKCETRLYDKLFKKENPDEGGDFISNLNQDSMKIVSAFVEPATVRIEPGTRFQFERLGYFCSDIASSGDSIIFNRIVTLKDAWNRMAQKA